MENLLAMAVFALVASISPGPVNLVALAIGARAGIRAGHSHVLGATLGFVALLVLAGLGLHRLLAGWPAFALALHWAGVAFLVYMACKLLRDDGAIGPEGVPPRASFWNGALMQWLNPKAWLAATAGIGLYADDSATALAQFAALYLLICYPSLLCWVCAGTLLQGRLRRSSALRLLNRLLAVLLLLSAAYLAWPS